MYYSGKNGISLCRKLAGLLKHPLNLLYPYAFPTIG